MNEQTTKLLQQLADKFGTTAEHLWAVLLRQAPISAFCNLFGLLFCCAASPILIAWSARLWRRAGKGEDCDGQAIAITIAAGVTTLVAVIAVIAAPESIIAGFFNPEYWALKQIIK